MLTSFYSFMMSSSEKPTSLEDIYVLLYNQCTDCTQLLSKTGQDNIDKVCRYRWLSLSGPEVIKPFSCSTQLRMKF